jgi:hypothetical protein
MNHKELREGMLVRVIKTQYPQEYKVGDIMIIRHFNEQTHINGYNVGIKHVRTPQTNHAIPENFIERHNSKSIVDILNDKK